MKGKGEVLLICDGTGFGYGSNCFVGWYRGKGEKEGEGTLQGCDGSGEKGCERMILGVRVEGRYADERKMFLRWLERTKEKIGEKVKFVANGLYGKSIEILREMRRRGWEMCVKVKKGYGKE